MSLPIRRTLLFAVPLLAAVGVAAACGPYCEPARTCPATTNSLPPPPVARCPQLAPQPCIPPPMVDAPPPAQDAGYYYYQPVTNERNVTTYVPRYVPAGISGTSLTVADGKLQVQTADGARMSCEKLTILVGGVDPAEVSIADNLIKITSGKDVREGSFLQASARKVTRTGADGAQLVLEGEAKLLYVRKGKKIEVSTDLLSVNLSTGQVLSEMDAPKLVTPLPPSTGTGSSDAPPPPVSSPPVSSSPRVIRSTGTERRSSEPRLSTPPARPQ